MKQESTKLEMANKGHEKIPGNVLQVIMVIGTACHLTS
jgi:hypothetical protein